MTTAGIANRMGPLRKVMKLMYCARAREIGIVASSASAHTIQSLFVGSRGLTTPSPIPKRFAALSAPTLGGLWCCTQRWSQCAEVAALTVLVEPTPPSGNGSATGACWLDCRHRSVPNRAACCRALTDSKGGVGVPLSSVIPRPVGPDRRIRAFRPELLSSSCRRLVDREASNRCAPGHDASPSPSPRTSVIERKRHRPPRVPPDGALSKAGADCRSRSLSAPPPISHRAGGRRQGPQPAAHFTGDPGRQ